MAREQASGLEKPRRKPNGAFRTVRARGTVHTCLLMRSIRLTTDGESSHPKVPHLNVDSEKVIAYLL